MAGAGRGKNYTDDKLKQLCYSVLHVSQDPAIGNGQRAEKFWDGVGDHYNHHRPKGGEVRIRKSLEGKWADIKHDVAKFIGCYSQVEGRQTSGTNQDDTFVAAKELYKSNHPKGKNFGYDSAWTILRDAPRWKTLVDDMAKVKAQKKTSKEKDNSSPSPKNASLSDAKVDEYDSTNGSGLKRPKGNNQAKEEIKRAKVQEDALRLCAEAQKEQALATKDMAKANFLRARVMENNSRLAILSLPVDSMSPELQAFMAQWKMEEAMTLKSQMQQIDEPQVEAQLAPAPTQATARRNPLPTVRIFVPDANASGHGMGELAETTVELVVEDQEGPFPQPSAVSHPDEREGPDPEVALSNEDFMELMNSR